MIDLAVKLLEQFLTNHILYFCWSVILRKHLWLVFLCTSTYPKPRPGFPTPYIFVCGCLRCEVVFHFFDIGVIVDDRCLNISKMKMTIYSIHPWCIVYPCIAKWIYIKYHLQIIDIPWRHKARYKHTIKSESASQI